MAWTYQARGYKNIVVKVGGIIQDTPEIMYFPALLQAGVDRIVNRGFSSANYTLTGNSYSTPDNYYNTTALVPYIGDFDFYSWLDSIAVGGTIEIWNSNIGEAFKFIFTKIDRYQATVSARYGSSLSSNAFYLNLPYNDSETYVVNPCCGFGFAFDLANYAARPVFLSIRTYKLGETVNESKYEQNGPEIYNNFRNPFSIAAIAIFSEIYTPPTPSSDPYADGGYSETMEGTTGDFDDTSDAIAEPTAPALSAVDSGLITLYGVDRANIRAFASYLFGSSFDPANFHKLFESPMEAILCLNYMPYTPSSAAATATEISFGAAGTGANGRVIGNQYETIDCGTLDLNEFYGSCLDYSPYTTITLVLPYASAVDIDPDEFNTKTIGIKYRIDNYTGAGLVLISDGTSVLMQIPCTVANPLPISASNYSSIVSAIANTAIVSAGAILAVATGGVGTGAAIALAGGVAASTAGNVMSAKLHYNHGGAGGMGTGMFGIQKPYLIIKRPRQCLPDGNNSFQGYPTFCTKNLGNVSGFTKVFQIHLDSISATDAEKKELESILKGGVWF